MVLQRLEGCSDREAVDRFAYLRWKYGAGAAVNLARLGVLHLNRQAAGWAISTP